VSFFDLSNSKSSIVRLGSIAVNSWPITCNCGSNLIAKSSGKVYFYIVKPAVAASEMARGVPRALPRIRGPTG